MKEKIDFIIILLWFMVVFIPGGFIIYIAKNQFMAGAYFAGWTILVTWWFIKCGEKEKIKK